MRRARRILPAVLVPVLIVAAWACWLAADALRAKDALESVAADVTLLRAQVLGGENDTAAARTLTSVQERAATARAATSGPHWTVAAVFPVVGASVEAITTVGAVADDLATDVLPALLHAASVADSVPLSPVDGRVDVAALVAAAPSVVAADVAVQQVLRTVRTAQGEPLLPGVARPLARLDAQIADIAATTATAARAVQLLPPMLGADGPRHYLLLVQNNAELRATGGIPGVVLLLRADDGAVEVVEQRSGGALGDLPDPVLPLTDEERAIFGDDLAADMRDVTFTPDFPRSAQIARSIWTHGGGVAVDGVLSVDPGALAHVLGATGPVQLADGAALTADNAVRRLLNGVYLDVAVPEDQDAFFAATADAVFDAVLTGRGQSPAVVDALATGAREGRLNVWSAHEEEQALLSGTVLSGELRGAAGDRPVVGVYFNDAIPAKMGYYLRADVRVTVTGCTPAGAPTATLTVDLVSTAPADAATLPAYVTGTEPGFPRGDLRTNVLVYAPSGGHVETVLLDGVPTEVFAQTHEGLRMVGRTVQLAPGGSVRITADVVGGPGQHGVPVLRTTPVASGTTAVEGQPDCS